MPDEPENKSELEIGHELKRESLFEEPERKFRKKEQQQEPREGSNSSQVSSVPAGFNIFRGRLKI